MCQPFRALPVFWGQHVKEEMAEGEKRISKASFPAQTLSRVWGLHCEDVGVLPSFLFHEGIDISNLLLVQVKSSQTRFSCKLLWQFCPVDVKRLSPKCVHIWSMQHQAQGSPSSPQRERDLFGISCSFHTALQTQIGLLPSTQVCQGAASILHGWHSLEPWQLHPEPCQMPCSPLLLLHKALTLLISARPAQKMGEPHRGGSVRAAMPPAVTKCWGWNEEKLGDKKGQEGRILLSENKYALD